MKFFITISFLLLSSFLTFGQLTQVYNEINQSTNSNNIRNSFIYKNQYAFVDGNYQANLWLSDGTKEGTRIISTSANNQGEPVIIQDKIILVDYDWDNSKYDLYSITENSKELLREDLSRFNRLVATNSIAFFYDENQIWRTDGTVAGTYSIETFPPSNQIPSFFIIKNHVHFIKDGFAYRNDGINGNEFIMAVGDDFIGFNSNGIFLNDIYYFSSTSLEFGSELWRTDFTNQGTYQIKDLSPGMLYYDTTRANSSRPESFETV